MNLADAYTFWEYIKPTQGEYLELRINHNFENYNERRLYYLEMENFQSQNKSIIVKKGSQVFVKNLEEFKTFINYNNNYFMKKVRVFYGLSKRVMKDKHISGGYANIDNIDIIFFDIDKKDHTNTEYWEQKYLDLFMEYVIDGLKKYGLEYPTKIHSGAGRHLLYKTNRTKITEGRKLWFKNFVKTIKQKYVAESFGIDGVKDFSRVFGLPGSMNVKRGRQVKILELNNKINDKFKIKSKKLPKTVFTKQFEGTEREAAKKILNNKMVKILINKKLPSGGNTNNILIYQLKILLKLHNFTENHIFVKKLFAKIQQVQQEKYPSNFPTGELYFNRKYVNSYFEELDLPVIYKIKDEK